jgi:hypothetical protein
MKTRSTLWTAALLCACGGQTIDVGQGTGGAAPGVLPGNPVSGAGGAFTSGQDAAAGGAPLPWPDAGDCVATSNVRITGIWDGYTENASDPWDKVRLVINGATEGGSVCGTIALGTGTAPPPPTDPNVGYPPIANFGGMPNSIAEGFPFTMLDGTYESGRVRFGFASTEYYKTWCALQTPYQVNVQPPQYQCVPPSGGGERFGPDGCFQIDRNTQKETQFDCSRLALCNSGGAVCACSASGCEASRDANFKLDLHFDTAQGYGSSTASTYTIRLFRAD